MRTTGVVTISVALALGGAAGRTSAQGIGAWEVGVASLEDELSLFQVGYRALWAKPGSAGVEFAIAIAPQFLSEGALVFAQDVDLAFAFEASPDVTLVLRGGGSLFAAMGAGGAGALPAYNAGAGLVVRSSPGSGVRFDVTKRWLPDSEDRYSITSITVGIVVFR